MPFGEYLKDWLTKRRNRNRDEDRRQAERFLLSRRMARARAMLEDLRPRHSVQLVEELKATNQPGDRPSHRGEIHLRTCTASIGPPSATRAWPSSFIRRSLRPPPRLASSDRKAGHPRVPYTRGLKSSRSPRSSTCRAQRTCSRPSRFSLECGRERCAAGRWRDLEDASPLACLNRHQSRYDDQPLKTDTQSGRARAQGPDPPAPRRRPPGVVARRLRVHLLSAPHAR